MYVLTIRYYFHRKKQMKKCLRCKKRKHHVDFKSLRSRNKHYTKTCIQCRMASQKKKKQIKKGYISIPLVYKQMQQTQEAPLEMIHDRFFSLKDQGIEEPEQKSPEWFARRKGKLSGSKFSQLLFLNNQEDRVKYFEEVFEGRPKSPFPDHVKEYMKWGNKHEDTALTILLNNMKNMYAMEAPMVQHSEIKWLASSPDGFYELFDAIGNTYEKGCIEIKCPAKRKKCNDKPTYYYVPQMFMEMACSGHDKVIFCSWGLDKCRAWRMEWTDNVWVPLSNLIMEFKNTKENGSWDKYSVLQYRLKRACMELCDNATPLFEGDGWSPSL